MASIVNKLNSLGLINPPYFLVGGTHYETIMGSEAYGVSSDSSDKDIYGFAIPPKEYIFPHLVGKLEGFSNNIQRFEQYQQHHVLNKSSGTEYDLTIFGIVKYFRLCMENNPNVLDSLYTREACVLHQTPIGRMVRENRAVFLSKKIKFSFLGYAFSQINKLEIKNPEPGSKRYALKEKYGMDTKFAYHAIRLINEARQLLETGDMDLMVDNGILKSIRNGEWTIKDVKEWFSEKEKSMEALYQSSCLPHSPNEEKISELLFNCLEEHFGNLNGVIQHPNIYQNVLIEMRDKLNSIKF